MQSHSEGSFHLAATGKSRLKILCFCALIKLLPSAETTSLPPAQNPQASFLLLPTHRHGIHSPWKDVRDTDRLIICSEFLHRRLL
jgi:hypothetical protein